MSLRYTLGPVEQEIMNHLWQNGDKKVIDVHRYLNKKRRLAYTTIMTIMTRLVKKGFLTRKKLGRAYLYSPKVTKGQTAKALISRVFNSLVDQFGQEAVIAFSDEVKHTLKKIKK